ncbi:hypothetical protein FXO38_25346 [Capsicum annuum]|nr:hypothetical protein FXO38_25346 [Capsicum annuum]
MDANSKPIVSKQTFAAIVQAKLPSLNSGEAQIEIQHGTHLGKPAVFFKAEDYFVKLTKECKFTIVEKFYRGNLMTLCRNKARDDILKAQKEEPAKMDKEKRVDEDLMDEFQTVSRRKTFKTKNHQNGQYQEGNNMDVNKNKQHQAQNGTDHEQTLNMGTEQTCNNEQMTNHSMNRMDKNKKAPTQINKDDQNSQQSSHMINYKGETNTKQGNEEVSSRNYNDPHPMKDTHPIDPGDEHDNYLMLISDTSLEEDQSYGVIFTEAPDHMIDSSSQDEGGKELQRMETMKMR